MFQCVDARKGKTDGDKIARSHRSGLGGVFQRTQRAASRTMFQCQMPESGAVEAAAAELSRTAMFI